MSKIKVKVRYGTGGASFLLEEEKSFEDLAERIKRRIKKTGEGLLPREREELLEDKEKGQLGFIRSFTLMTRGDRVYPDKQSKRIKEYAEDGELNVTATFHYEGGI
ncbi:MAG: hypothetical protein GWO20_07410 [Candidatus Korarchaeota archaeon]|nr:hypothetical protein [Candidatus Korarchaeota archaeon]NIU83275.1 hypothetical protein [Candidatus Thorarchaeota archaeon]NIW13619.1 hypothetical protein [Candidatus Thorarchaeota archaeon]NIW51715.1 hypothetical protein [Candidatus Korarchaeota archaeon]